MSASTIGQVEEISAELRLGSSTCWNYIADAIAAGPARFSSPIPATPSAPARPKKHKHTHLHTPVALAKPAGGCVSRECRVVPGLEYDWAACGVGAGRAAQVVAAAEAVAPEFFEPWHHPASSLAKELAPASGAQQAPALGRCWHCRSPTSSAH